ncbi:ABC transporter ATP-binding protein/permease [Candidatus Bipolaricaulota bacterium]|nr:ABC transporter ATP-binding protein/permease [Candidatus Bipolaricaulota bacterium]
MRSLFRLYRFLRPYRLSAIGALALLLGMVGADLLIPRMTQRIIDDGIIAGDLRVIWTTALIMLGAALLSALFAVGNNYLSVRVAQNFAYDLRSALVRKVQTYSFANLDGLRTGRLITRSTSDVQMTRMIVMMSLRIMTRAPIWMIGSSVMLVLTSPRLALMIAGFVPVIALFIRWFAGKVRPLFLLVQQKLDRLNTVLQENLAGVRVVKAFVREEREIERFGEANVELMGKNIEVMRLVAVLIPTMTLVLNLGVAGAVWFGGRATLGQGMTIGQVVASINYIIFALFPLMMLAGMLAPIASADASASRILEVLDEEPRVREQPNARRLEDPQGRIVFENVCFSYGNDRAEPILADLSFVAEPGETVAILGATGSGKSTLIHLIPRFYDVTAGRVTFDGVDVRELQLRSLRAQIGIALQEAILFGGTIDHNIRYGRPDATEDEMIVAAQAAQAAEFIEAFPDGYNTVIGQRGVTLSGGQRQRIAIARALLVRPKVLILDDSTSAVDIETEIRLQDALDQLIAMPTNVATSAMRANNGPTQIIVAQRISTVLLADKILVLDRGRIESIGMHSELLEKSPIYHEIYRSQLGEGVFASSAQAPCRPGSPGGAR